MKKICSSSGQGNTEAIVSRDIDEWAEGFTSDKRFYHLVFNHYFFVRFCLCLRLRHFLQVVLESFFFF